MNRTKSILLAATALAIFAAPQVARAQAVTNSRVTFLAPPVTPSANQDIFPDSQIVVRDISADGSTVLADYVLPSGSPNQSVVNRNTNNIWVWTNGTSRTVAITRPAPPSGERSGNFSASNISGDGQVIVGSLLNTYTSPTNRTFNLFRPVYWTQATGLTYLPDISATEIAAQFAYVNATGSFFAVTGKLLPYNTDGTRNALDVNTPRKAYRYSPTGGYQNLGSLGANVTMNVRGINGPGNVIFGDAYDLLASNFDVNGDIISRGVFRWAEGAGLSRLPDLSANPQNGALKSYSIANGISSDGSTIVGESIGSDGRSQAVYWRAAGVQSLGFLPGLTALVPTTLPPSSTVGATTASAASADGSVIVGTALATTGGLAWRWDASSGMQDLNVLARNAALNLNGFTLSSAVGVSDNGQFITGNAYNGVDAFGSPLRQLGFVLQIAQAAPTTLSTTARLIVTLTLPGVTQTSIVNQSFSTQVNGLLNGATVFTRTVTDPITGASGVTALADARAALQVGGGLRRVVIGAPTLVSNTTAVLNSTTNTVNVASGTQVTNAAVVTNGPATVATGDLGTCATAATNGVNPTGCSLAGTPVSVNANVINTNTFTNTINSVTPTTTTTVNQLVSAKWQVSATAGNQFGTVHALVGPVAFERGDRLIGQLVAMGGAGNSSAPLTRAAVGGSGLTMFGGYFGNWARIDADSRAPVANVRGNTNGFVLGLEKALGDARIGVAVDHGTSDYTVRDPQYAETLAMKATQVGLFANWKSGGFALDGAAAYGFGTVRTTLTTPTSPATATRDVRSWSLGAQAGYRFDVDATRVTLVAGVRHTSVRLNAFTETGGPTPLSGLSKTVTRTRLYGGVEVATNLDIGGITLTPRVHARAANDSGDASGVADLVFASAPTGPTLQAFGPGVGRTVAELGGSLDAAVGGNVHLWAGYDGTFRSGTRSHSAKAGVTVAF